jgi:hypothetical protein
MKESLKRREFFGLFGCVLVKPTPPSKPPNFAKRPVRFSPIFNDLLDESDEYAAAMKCIETKRKTQTLLHTAVRKFTYDRQLNEQEDRLLPTPNARPSDLTIPMDHGSSLKGPGSIAGETVSRGR